MSSFVNSLSLLTVIYVHKALTQTEIWYNEGRYNTEWLGATGSVIFGFVGNGCPVGTGPCILLSGNSHVYHTYVTTTNLNDIYLMYDITMTGWVSGEKCSIQQDVDGNAGDNDWNTQKNYNSGNVQLTQETTSLRIGANDNSVGVTIRLDSDGVNIKCYFQHLYLYGTEISTGTPTNIPTSNPTTNIPTTDNPTTSIPTTSIPTTSIPTSSSPTNHPTVIPTVLPTMAPSNIPTTFPTETPINSGQIDLNTTTILNTDNGLTNNQSNNNNYILEILIGSIGVLMLIVFGLCIVIYIRKRKMKLLMTQSNQMEKSTNVSNHVVDSCDNDGEAVVNSEVNNITSTITPIGSIYANNNLLHEGEHEMVTVSQHNDTNNIGNESDSDSHTSEIENLYSNNDIDTAGNNVITPNTVTNSGYLASSTPADNDAHLMDNDVEYVDQNHH